MKFFVHKNPTSAALALCKELPDNETLPEPWELMTVEAFETWKAEQLAQGWVPETVQPVSPRLIEKETILRRVDAAGKLSELISLLQSNMFPQNLKYKWDHYTMVDADHPAIAQGLTAIGLDPETILAP